MKQEKGITLIALVITIIVLLILAGVTIAMLTSDNSAPAKANKAAQLDALAAAKDQCAMTAMEAITNYYHSTYVVSGSSSDQNTGAQAAVKTAIENLTLDTVTKSAVGTDGTFTLTSKKDSTLSSTGTISATGSITWVNSAAWTATN